MLNYLMICIIMQTIQLYAKRVIHRIHGVWMNFNSSCAQKLWQKKEAYFKRIFLCAKDYCKHSRELSPNCVRTVDNSFCRQAEFRADRICRDRISPHCALMCWFDTI